MNCLFQRNKLLPIALFCAFFSSSVIAFDSGSSGADGALNITEDTSLDLPANGVFNFTTVNIAANATLSFNNNIENTPVILLVSGDVTVSGTISVNGGNAPNVDENINGAIFRDPGVGAPGGFSGGKGGTRNSNGSMGFGPGFGGGGVTRLIFGSGNGGSFGTEGSLQTSFSTNGGIYGNVLHQPLIGGSGGGGGAGPGGSNPAGGVGGGGGGGGGAILIAASGAIELNNLTSISANGGLGGGGDGLAISAGAGGSGGAIRLVATSISGNGGLSAIGGTGGASTNAFGRGATGGLGRITIEADQGNFTGQSTPGLFLTSPQPVIIADLPTLRIASVAGIVPTAPQGGVEVVLPLGLPNPVTVEFATTGIPLGSTIDLRSTPDSSSPTTATSTPVGGTEESGTATASINIPVGNSTLSAQVSFTVTASIGDDMSRFAQGERVKRITLASNIDGSSETVLTTVSGKEYRYDGNMRLSAALDS